MLRLWFSALFATGEATLFSWDVAVQKARTVIYYSSHDFLNFGLKVGHVGALCRFLAQCNYPPRHRRQFTRPVQRAAGDVFTGLLGNHCDPAGSSGSIHSCDPNLALRTGSQFSWRLWAVTATALLVGAIGMSGDWWWTRMISPAQPAAAIFSRHSQSGPTRIFPRGTRLPCAKFRVTPAILCQ